MLLTCCAEKRRGEMLLLTCCAEICNLLVQLFAEIFGFMTRRLTENFTCVLPIFVCGDQNGKFTEILTLGAGPPSVNFNGDFASIFAETFAETLTETFAETLRRLCPTMQTGI